MKKFLSLRKGNPTLQEQMPDHLPFPPGSRPAPPFVGQANPRTHSKTSDKRIQPPQKTKKRAARQGPLPQIIKAYQNVFQKLPTNWPPNLNEK